jgi:hypothetical protein
MDISPNEAEEALAAIETMVQKTRQAISKSGAYAFLIVWGVIWLLGFLASHFLPGKIAGNAWIALDIVGGVLSVLVGLRLNRSVRSPGSTSTGKRVAWFWLLLFIFCAAAIGVASPIDGKQLAMFIILFVMVGWLAMSLLFCFASVWWGLAITALALFGYFILPGFFFLWMAVLGGGGMIALGIFIRNRW